MIEVERVELLGCDIQAEQVLVLRPGVNLITGENGSGKTAILDGIKVALGATRIGADRSVDDYLRARAAPVAMVRLVASNREDPATRRRPFDVLDGGFERDQVSLAAVFRATDEGYERRDYLVDGDRSPLAPGVEARAFQRRSDYRARLERLGLGRSFRTLITTPQGEVASLCRRDSTELFDLLFDFIGGREVLEEWERLARDYEAVERQRADHAAALTESERRYQGLRKRLEVHERFLGDRRDLGRLDSALPLARRRRLAGDLRELEEEARGLEAQAEEAERAAARALSERDVAVARREEHRQRIEALGAEIGALAAARARVDDEQVRARVVFERLEELRVRAEDLPVRDLSALEAAAARARRETGALDHRSAELEVRRETLRDELSEIDKGVLPPPDAVKDMRARLSRAKVPHQLLYDILEPEGGAATDRKALESFLGELRFAVAVPDVEAFVQAVELAREARFPFHVLAPDVRSPRPSEGEHPLLFGVRVKEPRYEGLIVRLLRRVRRLGSDEPVTHTFRERGARVDPEGFVLDRVGGVHRGTDRFYLGRAALERRRRQLEEELRVLAEAGAALEEALAELVREIELLDREAAEERTRREWTEKRPTHVEVRAELGRLESRREEIAGELGRLEVEQRRLHGEIEGLGERIGRTEQLAGEQGRDALQLRKRRDATRRRAQALAEELGAVAPRADEVERELGRGPEADRAAVAEMVQGSTAETIAALAKAREASLSQYAAEDRDENLPANVRTLERQVADVRHELQRIAEQVDDARRAAAQAHEQYQRTTRRVFRHYFARLAEEALPIGFSVAGTLRDRDDGRFAVHLEVSVGEKAPVPYTSHSLSGGEKAALSILMGMTTMAAGRDSGPGFFIVDEPFSASDTHKIGELGTFLARTGGQYLISMPTSMDIAHCGPWLRAVLTCTRSPGGVDEAGELRLAPSVKLSVVEPDE